MTSDETLDRLYQRLDDHDASKISNGRGESSTNLRFWLILTGATLPLLLAYFYEMIGARQFAFIPLAFALVGFLYWRRSDEFIGRPSTWFQWMPIGFAAICVLLSIAMSYPWFSALAFVLVAGAFFNNVGGNLRPTLAHLTAPLLCILKPPFQFDGTLVAWINRISAWFSSIVFDRFEIPHSINGSVVQLFESEVLTSDVNSGFVSFYFILFLAFSLIAWKRVSLWLMPVYFVAALMTTIAVNSLRVVLHVIAIRSLEVDLMSGWYPIGMTCLAAAIAFGLLYSFHHLIAITFHFIEPNENAGINPFVYLWNRLSFMNDNRAFEEMSRVDRSRDRTLETPIPNSIWFSVVGISSLLALLSLVQFLRSPTTSDDATAATRPLVETGDDFFSGMEATTISLSSHKFDVEQKASGTSLRNDEWEGTYQNAMVKLQITQPLVGWWELTTGYERAGWELLDRDVTSLDASGKDVIDSSLKAPFVFARLRQSNPNPVESYLFYSAVSDTGKIQATPTAFESLAQRFRRRMGLSNSDETDSVAMIQLWIVSQEKLTPADLRTLRREFVEYRDRLATSVAGIELSGQSEPAERNAYDETTTPETEK